MTYERLVKRTIFEAKCSCGWKDVVDKNPPREIQCPKCRTWLSYSPISWTGPDFT